MTANWSAPRAETLAALRVVFACHYFWLGYREAFQQRPPNFDRRFGGLVGDELKVAQLRYENGRECCLGALSDGVREPWASHARVPVELLSWALSQRDD